MLSMLFGWWYWMTCMAESFSFLLPHPPFCLYLSFFSEITVCFVAWYYVKALWYLHSSMRPRLSCQKIYLFLLFFFPFKQGQERHLLINGLGNLNMYHPVVYANENSIIPTQSDILDHSFRSTCLVLNLCPDFAVHIQDIFTLLWCLWCQNHWIGVWMKC